jgi:hypothetical protein
MRPLFLPLERHYPRVDTVGKAELFEEIGWDDLIKNSGYDNTCAIRMSVALIKVGVPIRGRMAIKNGPFAGQKIEPGQANLSNMLSQKALFGAPEKFDKQSVQAGIENRRGVMSFFRIPGYLGGRGGHIDIISPGAGGGMACGSGCYFNADEFWFWALGPAR